MDFSSRGGRPPVPSEQPATQQTQESQGNGGGNRSSKKFNDFDFHKLLSVILLLSVAILLLFSVAGVVRNDGSSTSNKQAAFVKTDQYQAVFLAGGQVYFGKITGFTRDYLVLEDIYYLRVNQQIQPGQQATENDITLAKLGNELHGPEDQMLINTAEVQFWENLQEDGQVVQAIRDFQANPEESEAGATQPTPTPVAPDTSEEDGTEAIPPATPTVPPATPTTPVSDGDEEQ